MNDESKNILNKYARAAWAAVDIAEDAMRQTGRTTRALQGRKEGDLFVTATNAFRDQLLAKGEPQPIAAATSLEQLRVKVSGARYGSVEFDNAVLMLMFKDHIARFPGMIELLVKEHTVPEKGLDRRGQVAEILRHYVPSLVLEDIVSRVLEAE